LTHHRQPAPHADQIEAPSGTILDLRPRVRAAMHQPGSIQPHGLLLVIDSTSELIVQSGGDANATLGTTGATLGKTIAQILGVSLADLAGRSGTRISAQPQHLGKIRRIGGGDVAISAHHSNGVTIVEIEHAFPSPTAAETLAAIRSITESIEDAPTLAEAFALTTAEMARIIRYDRVMIYRLLPDGSGSAVAETRSEALPPYLGHRFPASDIPQQALALYRKSPVRVIPDTGYLSSPLIPALNPLASGPLDMSLCMLRSASPVHIEYMRKMGVAAWTSVSLMVEGKLWGMIVCHNQTPRMVPYEALELCKHIGQILSRKIRCEEEKARRNAVVEMLAAREEVLAGLAEAQDLGRALERLSADIKRIVPADGIAILWKETAAMAGHVPSLRAAREIASWLPPHVDGDGVFATVRLGEICPAAEGYSSDASGLLAVVLPGPDPLVVMWFRPEEIEEVKWAGNPLQPDGPRSAFTTWSETIRGRSREWPETALGSVRAFGLGLRSLQHQQQVRKLNGLLGTANDKLAEIASIDGLTGLANRNAFDAHLQSERVRARRSGMPLALVTLDLDFFKQYNDHFGHPAGDECLRRIAKALQLGRRANDHTARIGGEEFAIILPDTDIHGASEVANALRLRIEALQIDHPKSLSGVMTASFGIAAVDAGTEGTVEDLMRSAGNGLYIAKASGKNRVSSSEAITLN